MNDMGTFLGTDYELKLVGLALLLGAVLGSWFDILRALRRSIKHHPSAVFIEDVIFAAVFGLAYYTFGLSLCSGDNRAFVLLSMIAGFLIYIYTLGRIVSDFFSLTLQAVVKIVKKCISLLCVVQHFKKREEKIDEPS